MSAASAPSDRFRIISRTTSGGGLHVRIDDDHSITVGIGQSGTDCGLMAEIARQKHGLNPCVISGKACQYLGRTVPATIIDKDDLQAKIPVPHHLDEPRVCQRDDALFVEAGHDNR